MVLPGGRQGHRLMHNEDIVFIMLAEVLLCEIKALHAGDLQLKEKEEQGQVSVDVRHRGGTGCRRDGVEMRILRRNVGAEEGWQNVCQ